MKNWFSMYTKCSDIWIAILIMSAQIAYFEFEETDP